MYTSCTHSQLNISLKVYPKTSSKRYCKIFSPVCRAAHLGAANITIGFHSVLYDFSLAVRGKITHQRAQTLSDACLSIQVLHLLTGSVVLSGLVVTTAFACKRVAIVGGSELLIE